MANTNKCPGLRPIYPYVRAQVYKHVTGVPIYMYQPATLNGSGYAEIAVTDGTSAGEAILGSVVGILGGDWSPLSVAQGSYAPAYPPESSADSNGYVNVLIADSPEQLFVIQENDSGTALSRTAVGLGVVFTHLTNSITAATSGNTISGISTVIIDRTVAKTVPASNLSVQLIKLWDKPDNAYGDFAKWIVRINDHQYQRSGAFLINQSPV